MIIEKSELINKCIASWHKFCPDYLFVEWNEDNFDVNFCPYTAKAYQEKRWGFLSDVARLQIIYQNGGIYLDTDVELLRPIDDLLDNEAWFAYGTSTEINTGSGFGAVKGNFFVKKLLDQYLSFSCKKAFELCTAVDTRVFHREFPGFAADHDIRQEYNGILIINDIWRYVIHHYTNSWMTKRQKWMSQSKLVHLLRKIIKR